MMEARYYNKTNSSCDCVLCPHKCSIGEGCTGFCGVRKNIGGKLFAESYSKISSLAMDPIEKKPLYHFYPGSNILSVGSYGCNLKCPNCQNYKISIEHPETEETTPDFIYEYAVKLKSQGNIGIAYTYNEPLVGYEHVFDCAKLFRDGGLKNVLVTNGYIEQEPILELMPYIDAMNIDLKCFADTFYKELGGTLEPVKKTILSAKCHVEITTLIVPGKNDSAEEMRSIAEWLSGIDANIPLHITRFFPRYKMSNYTATSREKILELRNIALKHLKYVYTGNMY